MYLNVSGQQCRRQFKCLHSAIIQSNMQQFQSFWLQQPFPQPNNIFGIFAKLQRSAKVQRKVQNLCECLSVSMIVSACDKSSYSHIPLATEMLSLKQFYCLDAREGTKTHSTQPPDLCVARESS